MEDDAGSDPPSHPALKLQATSFPGYSAPTLSPAFRLDEGYSDDTPSQAEKETMADNAMSLPEWVLAQTEADRAAFAYTILRSLSTATLAGVVERLTPLLHMDPVLKLPPELTFQIFSYLEPRQLLTASLASRAWRSRILDSGLWRVLYIQEGWRVDLRAIRSFEQEQSEAVSPQTRRARPQCSDPDLSEPKQKKRVPMSWYDGRTLDDSKSVNDTTQPDNEGDHMMLDASVRTPQTGTEKQIRGSQTLAHDSISSLQPPLKSSLVVRMPNGSTRINWMHLYKQRRRLEANWHHGRFTNFQLPHPSHPEDAHLECVYAIQFAGKWLVSGSRDRTVRVWDLETKRLWNRPLVGHAKSVLCLQFDPSPAEDVIISGSSDRSVIVWRFSTGQKIHQITGAHADSVLNLKFDHRFLVTCSKDRTVKVWNRHDLLPNHEDYPRIFKGGAASYPSYIIDLKETAPNFIEANIANGHIKALKAYSLLMTVEGHGAAVNAMQLHGDEIVTASGDRLIKVWNIRNGTCVKTLMGHTKGIACVQSDSRRIISGSNDNTVRIYDHISGAEVACLRGHNNLVRTVQAGFGDPPGADEALRLEALEVDTAFWRAQQEGAPIEPRPSATRRAGHTPNTAGSRNPRDIRATGAKIPPGGGGSIWGRIVSGSYDESILIWHKDRDGAWSIGHRLRQSDAAANAARGTLSDAARAAIQTQVRHLQATQTPGIANIAAPNIMTGQQSNRPTNTPGQGSTPTPPVINNAPGATPAAQDSNVAAAGPSHIPAGPASRTNVTNTTAVNAAPQTPRPLPIPSALPGAPPLVTPQGVPPAGLAHLLQMPAPHPIPNIPRNRAPAPTSRVFKVQFDSRKIVCASVDPRIVGWDFACGDDDILEACRFFQGL
ncbi:Uncharacterized protein PECH_000612 [Penicillium ucsense]|uniref:Probable E3 ubiquitin ligase complex SCF subunit sconB n=1 Tax=Penicillium ucsense TaxID=2839758 RepID=A0A8J8VXQ5_9EURO|nr:Uncharacterized protein PECM_000668 [Penicillium ucsense]KAF7738347.1 Uncharacterized protein PECH_000612 [Penicillium ucsense]